MKHTLGFSLVYMFCTLNIVLILRPVIIVFLCLYVNILIKIRKAAIAVYSQTKLRQKGVGLHWFLSLAYLHFDFCNVL